MAGEAGSLTRRFSLASVVATLAMLWVAGPAAGQTPSKADPVIDTTATPSSAVIGTPVHDVASLSGGNNPTGTIEFRLFKADCTTQVFTSVVPVSGNGTYESGEFTPTEPGTYHWTASYFGDDNNTAYFGGCNSVNDPNETVVVSKADPDIATTATPSSAVVGTPVHDVASLSGGYNPTGSIQFTLFKADCTTQVFTSVVPVSGNGIYESEEFTPTEPGTYHWTARYFGDDNNTAYFGGCNSVNDPNETVVVTAAPVLLPTTPLSVTPTATCKGERATHVGTAGSDLLTGTNGPDVIAALDGNDKVSGLAGKDLICGGKGRDTLKGSKGKDKLLGQIGADTLKGGGGNDTCKGGKGADVEKSC